MTADEERVAERDAWAALAQERLIALETLKADRSAETIRTAGRLAQLAWILMVIIVLFTGTIIMASALRASARECPLPATQPQVERPLPATQPQVERPLPATQPQVERPLPATQPQVERP